MKHLTILLCLLANISVTTASGHGGEHEHIGVIEATDLQADGQRARQEKRAIMLLVSQEHCSFCVQIKQEVIGPMIKSGAYENRLIIRELLLDTGSDVIDFKGVRRESHDFSYDYKVSLTPTLLFLDANGNELVEKMVGIQTPDMFYYYVEQSVQAAISSLDK